MLTVLSTRKGGEAANRSSPSGFEQAYNWRLQTPILADPHRSMGIVSRVKGKSSTTAGGEAKATKGEEDPKIG